MAQYRIDELLEHRVQPFDDFTPEQLAAFGASFGEDLASSPIVVADTKPPILIEGSQRCRLYAERGRKVLEGHEVVVASHVTTRDQAYEEAVVRNVNRRPFTVEQKAALARELQTGKGWSQGKVAKLFGVSQPAVSQWLAKVPGETAPAEVVGADGKTYPTPARPAEPAPTPGTWSREEVDVAVTYLNRIGPKSNLDKVRRSLNMLLDFCRQDAELEKQWDAASSALDDAEERTGDDSGYDPEERREAREDLESAIEDLLGDIEQYDEDHAGPSEPAPKPTAVPEPKLSAKEKAAATRAARKAEKERAEIQGQMRPVLHDLEYGLHDLLVALAATELFVDVAGKRDQLEQLRGSGGRAWDELLEREPPLRSKAEQFERLTMFVSMVRRAVDLGRVAFE